MANSPYTSDAPEPMATRESMLGARCHSALKPVWKKCRLINSTGMVRSSWARAFTREFSIPTKNQGTGRPIMLPMAMYIKGTSNTMDEISRRFICFWLFMAWSWRACHSLRNPALLWAVAGCCSREEAP